MRGAYQVVDTDYQALLSINRLPLKKIEPNLRMFTYCSLLQRHYWLISKQSDTRAEV